MKIVVLERNSVGTDVSVDGFKRFGEMVTYPNTVGTEEVAERIKDADIVIANKAPLNEESLKDAPNVRMISEFATGYDNIDTEYCKKRGIRVCNVVNYSTDAVAQHTFALLFFVLEKLRHYDDYVKNGAYAAQSRFSNFDKPFTELAGKTWGIIGMGNIGQKVAKIASAFGCNVIFHSVTGKSKVTEYEQVSFDELLERADFLSLHCPLSPLTQGIINYDAFKKMKNTAFLINVARGPVVVDGDLKKALDEGLIAGAGLDVTGTEPMKDSNPLSEFKDSDKLIITPHLAWASTEARFRVVEENIKNIEAFLEGRERNAIV
ncbi:MAG: D-2-hydroxyacid dehydrogenase [Lachnospiraceae bacterium]|nr:D-2-hydroxyacid dehydrogenase [Lachnospiraceae bacterium]